MRSREKDQQSDMLDKYKGRKIFVYQNGIGQVSHNYDDIGINRSPGNYGQVVSFNEDESPGFYSPLKMANYHQSNSNLISPERQTTQFSLT